MYSGPHIKRDGLVFGYDTGANPSSNFDHKSDQRRFFKGKPAVNTWYKDTFNYTNGDATVTRNVTPPVPPPPEAQGYEICKLQSNDGSLVQTILWRSGVDQVNGGAYVHSVYCYLESGSTVTVGQHWNPWAYGGSQYPPLGKWVRLSQTVTNSANNYGNIANAYRTNGVAYFTATQYELGSTPSPFVDGTRSSTQSLIDLTKTTDIDVSNVSFDSTGQPTFDGTDDILNTGLFSGRNPSTSPFTIEAILKSDTTSGNRMWLDATSNGSNQRFYSALDDGGNNPLGIQGSSWQDPIPNTTNFIHQTIVMDGSTARSYRNGVATYTKPYTPYTLAGPLNIGGRSGYRWIGTIPIVKIYNRTLSAEEIKQNFRAYKNRFDI